SLGMVGVARDGRQSGRRRASVGRTRRAVSFRSMKDLPAGTVAFLMTDIEGSTRLIPDVGPAFPALLEDHFRLLGEAVAAHGGTVVATEGDSVFAVFASARQALEAAADGQR